MGENVNEPAYCLSDQLHPLDTSSQISQWVTTHCSVPNIFTCLDLDPGCSGPPVLASVSKGVPGIFMDCHMMVSQPEKVRSYITLLSLLQSPKLTPAVMSG